MGTDLTAQSPSLLGGCPTSALSQVSKQSVPSVVADSPTLGNLHQLLHDHVVPKPENGLIGISRDGQGHQRLGAGSDRPSARRTEMGLLRTRDDEEGY